MHETLYFLLPHLFLKKVYNGTYPHGLTKLFSSFFYMSCVLKLPRLGGVTVFGFVSLFCGIRGSSMLRLKLAIGKNLVVSHNTL